MYKLTDIWGNIGAGKSTLMAELKKSIAVKFIDEPLKEWLEIRDDSTGMSLLETYYDDPKRWSYSFQHCALVSRVEFMINCIKENPDVTDFVSERSPLADKIFADCLHENGTMNELEYKLYTRWFGFLMEYFSIKVSHIVYLDTKPEVCYERMLSRARVGESSGCSLEFLKELDAAHRKAVEEAESKGIRISVIDTTGKSPEEIAREVVLALASV